MFLQAMFDAHQTTPTVSIELGFHVTPARRFGGTTVTTVNLQNVITKLFLCESAAKGSQRARRSTWGLKGGTSEAALEVLRAKNTVRRLRV